MNAGALLHADLANTLVDARGLDDGRAFFNDPVAFRLLDAAEREKRSDSSDTRQYLVFARGGHRAVLRLDAASVSNPFVQTDLQRFRCE